MLRPDPKTHHKKVGPINRRWGDEGIEFHGEIAQS